MVSLGLSTAVAARQGIPLAAGRIATRAAAGQRVFPLHAGISKGRAAAGNHHWPQDIYSWEHCSSENRRLDNRR